MMINECMHLGMFGIGVMRHNDIFRNLVLTRSLREYDASSPYYWVFDLALGLSCSRYETTAVYERDYLHTCGDDPKKKLLTLQAPPTFSAIKLGRFASRPEPKVA